MLESWDRPYYDSYSGLCQVTYWTERLRAITIIVDYAEAESNNI